MVNLTTADIADSTGAQVVLDALVKRWPRIKHLFADSAYDRRQLLDKAAFLDFTVEIVKRTETAFVALPRRRVVEWTFGWMTRHRRLVRDLRGSIGRFSGHDRRRHGSNAHPSHHPPIVLKRTLRIFMKGTDTLWV